MKNFGDIPPFDVNVDNLDVLDRACHQNPTELSMQGWNLLEDSRIAFQLTGEQRSTQTDDGWALEVGLGFGVGLGVLQLQTNLPDCDVSHYLAFPKAQEGQRPTEPIASLLLDSVRMRTGELAVFSNMGGILGRLATGCALRRFNLRTANQVRLARASMVLGYRMVRVAHQEWMADQLAADPASLDAEITALLKSGLDEV